MMKTAGLNGWVYFIVFIFSMFTVGQTALCSEQNCEREVLLLNGTWEICQGSDDQVPGAEAFRHTVPVPGLIDLATPLFEEVGTEKSRTLRESFWYRRTFTIESDVPAFARLLFRKVKYGCSVYLNGVHLGDGARLFTPLYFDAAHALKGNGAINELVVRVGAHRGHEATKSYPDGHDKEKHTYFPGIYDDVELIMTGTVYIDFVQVAPDLERSGIMVEVAMLNTETNENPVGASVDIDCRVCEAKSGKQVAAWIYKNSTRGRRLKGNQLVSGVPGIEHMFIPIPDARLWSPDDPFLYTLEVKVIPIDSALSGDTCKTRFGMRRFAFDPEEGCGILNGKKTYLTGSNFCIYRFFEDVERGGLPWDEGWVRKLFRTSRKIGWNSVRFSIGPAPDFWYDIADEEGLLIQDEYAIWSGHDRWKPDVTGETLAECFRAWMRNRWNHPCVVIWDAQNETFSKGRTMEAIRRVRGEDLSNRPWDVAWEEPMYLTDPVEFHYYPLGKWNIVKWTRDDLPRRGHVEYFATRWKEGRIAKNNGLPVKRAVSPCSVMNEYNHLWLKRNGDPTQLSTDAYDYFLGEGHSPEQRQELYYRYLGMMTELFRSTRSLAGVMHFAGLLGDFPDNMTGDQFVDIVNLELNPYFVKYAESSFAPVGLMVDLWEPSLDPGARLEVPVNIINDLDKDWKGSVTISLWDGERVIQRKEMVAAVPSVGRVSLQAELNVPEAEGQYEVVAELVVDGREIVSRRIIFVE